MIKSTSFNKGIKEHQYILITEKFTSKLFGLRESKKVGNT
jgi:hypothetical protein